MRFGRPNTNREIPNVFNKKQLVILFSQIDNPTIFMGCFISLFCGLRISEVCNLKKQDIDLESEKVIVRQGKGDKDRVVMLPHSLKNLIIKWYRVNKDNEYFIHTEYGRKFKGGQLSIQFRKYLKRAELSIETFKNTHGQQRYAYSFHTLRHTYATYLLEQGVDLYYVQRSLGHVDIHTTQIYAYISNKDLQNKINLAFGQQKKTEHTKASQNITDPMQLLKLRYVNGDITIDEFKEKIEVMQSLEKEELF